MDRFEQLKKRVADLKAIQELSEIKVDTAKNYDKDQTFLVTGVEVMAGSSIFHELLAKYMETHKVVILEWVKAEALKIQEAETAAFAAELDRLKAEITGMEV